MRQYIGARYVPLFMGEWNPKITYAPLSIVMYGNASYTSKIPVPAGTLPTDTKYWYVSGNYNGQIQALDQKIDSTAQNLQSQIDIHTQNIAALSDEIAEIGTQSYIEFLSTTLFMYDNDGWNGKFPNMLYVPNGAIYSGTWKIGWEAWENSIKPNIKTIVFLGGKSESVSTTYEQLITTCNAFGGRNIIYIWTYDEWRTANRVALYNAMKNIELLPHPGNFKFETLMGFAHYNVYYSNGFPNAGYYNLLSRPVESYLKGNQFLTAQFISQNYGECIIDGHTAYFAANIITVSAPNWTEGSYIDVPTDSFFNPGNFTGFIIGYAEGNTIQVSFNDYMTMRVQQLSGTNLSGTKTITFPDFSYSMHIL